MMVIRIRGNVGKNLNDSKNSSTSSNGHDDNN